MLRPSLILASLAVLAACSPADQAGSDASAIAIDPMVARALHDPLMSDPDLSARNEAIAVIAFVDTAALPVLGGSAVAARQAREAARLELLDAGEIPGLPLPSSDIPVTLPSADADAAELLAALGAPKGCAGQLDEGFDWAVDMPGAAAIMPHGMVVQAAGARTPGCRVRIVRYRTAAAISDVLQYHYTRTQRAGLDPARLTDPDGIVAGGGAGERVVVAVRARADGLNAVTLLHRIR